MEIISAAGWLLRKVADTVASTVIGKATQLALSKVGVFDARCESCNTKQSAVIIPEDRPFTLECPKCGHVGTILIESVDRLIIHQIKNAGIVIDNANVLIKQANTISRSEFPSLPESSKQHKESIPTAIPHAVAVTEFEASGGIIVQRKIVEKAIKESIDYVHQHGRGMYYPIKKYLLVDIKASPNISSGNDMLSPEIWIVPDSRKNMEIINNQ